MSRVRLNDRFSASTHGYLPARQSGMAMVIVLWLIVLLSIIATGHARNVHSETRLAMRYIESAKARTLAESGIQRAIISLMLNNGDSQWPVNGVPQRITIDGREVSIAVRDATGLVDLNAADAGLLAALLATTGGDPLQKEKLVDAILDWRDTDNFTHLHGAEGADYRAAGLDWTPRNSAFSSIDELRYVIGMTPERFMAILPYITVYSGKAGLNLNYAPPNLISMLSGQPVETADSEDPTPSSDRLLLSRATARNGTYHIYASATGNSHVSASVEAVVNISMAAEQPYSILSWREPARFRFPEMD